MVLDKDLMFDGFDPSFPGHLKFIFSMKFFLPI